MVNYLSYFTLVVIFIWLIYKTFLVINYKFWAYQPVFHKINLIYYLLPNHIINTNLPDVNKFCNFNNILTNDILTLKNKEILEIIKFLTSNFISNKNDKWELTHKDFISNFQGNLHINLLSRYYIDNYFQDKEKIVSEKKLVGIITGRSLNLTIDKKSFPVYYVDNLCVDKNFRKKDIATNLIQTQEFFQRHKNKKISVSLFKREGSIMGIEALTNYKIYQFDLLSLLETYNNNIKIIEINEKNFLKMIDFITKKKELFKIWVFPDISNFNNMIKNNIYKIYVSLDEFDDFENLYIFQNTNVSFQNKKSIEIINSIITNNNRIENDLYYILQKISKSKQYFYINISDLSDNIYLLKILFSKSKKYDYDQNCAYFLYNYKINEIDKKDCFIIT